MTSQSLNGVRINIVTDLFKPLDDTYDGTFRSTVACAGQDYVELLRTKNGEILPEWRSVAMAPGVTQAAVATPVLFIYGSSPFGVSDKLAVITIDDIHVVGFPSVISSIITPLKTLIANVPHHPGAYFSVLVPAAFHDATLYETSWVLAAYCAIMGCAPLMVTGNMETHNWELEGLKKKVALSNQHGRMLYCIRSQLPQAVVPQFFIDEFGRMKTVEGESVDGLFALAFPGSIFWANTIASQGARKLEAQLAREKPSIEPPKGKAGVGMTVDEVQNALNMFKRKAIEEGFPAFAETIAGFQGQLVSAISSMDMNMILNALHNFQAGNEFAFTGDKAQEKKHNFEVALKNNYDSMVGKETSPYFPGNIAGPLAALAGMMTAKALDYVRREANKMKTGEAKKVKPPVFTGTSTSNAQIVASPFAALFAKRNAKPETRARED